MESASHSTCIGVSVIKYVKLLHAVVNNFIQLSVLFIMSFSSFAWKTWWSVKVNITVFCRLVETFSFLHLQPTTNLMYLRNCQVWEYSYVFLLTFSVHCLRPFLSVNIYSKYSVVSILQQNFNNCHINSQFPVSAIDELISFQFQQLTQQSVPSFSNRLFSVPKSPNFNTGVVFSKWDMCACK